MLHIEPGESFRIPLPGGDEVSLTGGASYGGGFAIDTNLRCEDPDWDPTPEERAHWLSMVDAFESTVLAMAHHFHATGHAEFAAAVQEALEAMANNT